LSPTPTAVTWRFHKQIFDFETVILMRRYAH